MSDQIRIACRGADTLPLDAIEDFQGNLKKRGKKEIEAIITSILRYGFSFPFFVWNGDGHNRCIDGHGRIQALAELRKRGVDLPLFPVAYIDAKDESEAKQKLLRLNSQYGAMSVDSVMEFAEGLDVAWDELALPSGTLEFGEGADGDATPTEGDDDIPEAVEPVTQLGDLYELGAHRLLCGDSTKDEDVRRLMGGDMAEMMWTDPPYGVAIGDKNKMLNAIGRSNRVEKNLENDTLDEEGLTSMLRLAFKNAIAHCHAGAAWYVAAPPGPLHVLFGQELKDLGVWHQTIQWVKNNATLSPLGVDYHWRSEPIFYGWKPGAGHRYYGGRKQDTVWECDRPSKSPDHPTMKPVALVARAVENSSKAGEIVLDLFLGSGSTLIASEQLGRKCYGTEIDPHYCDVIVTRYRQWCADNGREAVIKRNGEAFNG